MADEEYNHLIQSFKRQKEIFKTTVAANTNPVRRLHALFANFDVADDSANAHLKRRNEDLREQVKCLANANKTLRAHVKLEEMDLDVLVPVIEGSQLATQASAKLMLQLELEQTADGEGMELDDIMDPDFSSSDESDAQTVARLTVPVESKPLQLLEAASEMSAADAEAQHDSDLGVSLWEQEHWVEARAIELFWEAGYRALAEDTILTYDIKAAIKLALDDNKAAWDEYGIGRTKRAD
ncbi:hypothetical protein PInf_016663 [Phytophthora infestans]|nr:hypothetical protein PInf_016663 [Phytophthora infestans]